MSVLMNAATLNERLKAGARTVLLDVRWALGDPHGHEHYLAGHIPGAVYVDMDSELASHGAPQDGRHPLPAEADFARTVRRWGINAGDTVVIYDDAGPPPLPAPGGCWATRAWRTFTCSTADWPPGAQPTCRSPQVRRRRSRGTPSYGLGPRKPSTQMVPPAWAGILLDARAGERYRGEVEPIDPQAGHIPGALSAPTTENLAADKTFLPAEELRARFAALGVAEGAAVAVYCGSGVTAAHQIAALEIAGFTAALYPGSWSAWSNQPGRPVATGGNGDRVEA